MSNSIGSMLLPVPAPAPEEALGDPAIDILADFFETVLTADLKSAWESRVLNEPVVRRVYKYNPEEADFCTDDLPLLCVWRDDDNSPRKSMDVHTEIDANFMVLWIPPPADQQNLSSRHPFFSAFDHCMAHAVQMERHPAWKHPSEVTSTNPDTVAEANAYGSNVLRMANIDRWQLQSIKRIPVVVPVQGNREAQYPGYLAAISAIESTVTDPTAYGVKPFSVHGDLTTKDKQVVRTSFRVPT
jgi:hypothetical protein